MSESKDIIYIGDCTPQHAEMIQNELDVIVYTRLAANTWDTNSLMGILTDSRLILTVINKMSPEAIVEMTICDIFCKKILVTTKSFEAYDSLHFMVPINFRLYCDLDVDSNEFKKWFKDYKYMLPKVAN